MASPNCLTAQQAAAIRNYPPLGTLSSLCVCYSVLAGLVALFQRHKHNASFLTAWDEMAAFLGLALLTRLVAGILG